MCRQQRASSAIGKRHIRHRQTGAHGVLVPALCRFQIDLERGRRVAPLLSGPCTQECTGFGPGQLWHFVQQAQGRVDIFALVQLNRRFKQHRQNGPHDGLRLCAQPAKAWLDIIRQAPNVGGGNRVQTGPKGAIRSVARQRRRVEWGRYRGRCLPRQQTHRVGQRTVTAFVDRRVRGYFGKDRARLEQQHMGHIQFGHIHHHPRLVAAPLAAELGNAVPQIITQPIRRPAPQIQIPPPCLPCVQRAVIQRINHIRGRGHKYTRRNRKNQQRLNHRYANILAHTYP